MGPTQDTDSAPTNPEALLRLADQARSWSAELGFRDLRISAAVTDAASARLRGWLAAGRHGEMEYMQRHLPLRESPGQLLPKAAGDTVRVLSARLDYLPRTAGSDWADHEWERLRSAGAATVSIHARGRDYHKVLRTRLAQLAQRLREAAPEASFRACTDSAPVFEVEFARQAGLGWRGKHTLLLSRDAGSLFFLGEIITDLPLPVDAPVSEHCGNCRKCIDVCPTQAIVAPYELDARRCISYLTIEHRSAIPETLRPLIGNRIYGCDDCQLVCPWNKYAQRAALPDFDVRNGLDQAALIELFGWSEAQFRERHAGSAILRIGHERWLRNIAVALGNAPSSAAVIDALRARLDHPSSLVREHVIWALQRHAAAPSGSARHQSNP